MYKIRKIDNSHISNNVWDLITPIEIDNFPWDTTNYKPITSVKLFYTNDSLNIKFTSTERKVRIEEKLFNSSPYQDSCVEFFLMPMINDNRYFNFETNAAGTMLLQLDHKLRERNTLNEVDPSVFNIKADITDANKDSFDNFVPWTVEYTIPFSFLKNYFPTFEAKPGTILKGNFYKCGDKTEIPHYGCWNPITYHKPSFHRPEFFGDLILQ